MDVRCERCRARYDFDEDQITPAGLTVRCDACGNVFRVKKKELVITVPVKPGELDEESVPASSATPPRQPPGAEPVLPWTIRQASGQTLGFSELSTLQRWIVERKVTREDQVSHGDGVWVGLGTLAELQGFFEVVEVAFARPPALPSARAPSGDLDEADLRAVGRARRSRNAFIVLLVLLVVLVAGAAAANLLLPAFLGGDRPPRPEPIAVPPAAATRPPPPEPRSAPRPEPGPEVMLAAPEPTPDPPAAKAPGPVPKIKAPALKKLLAEARRLREASRSQQAIDIYGRITAQDPGNVEALAGRGLCYFDLEQYGPAEASLLEALRRSPVQAEALLGLAETYRAQGRKAEAIAMFDRYLAAHPRGEEAGVARNAINQLKD
jgi:predicted Zn finger-like uncharacterized protein